MELSADGPQTAQGSIDGATPDVAFGPDVFFRFELPGERVLRAELVSDLAWWGELHLLTGACDGLEPVAFADTGPDRRTTVLRDVRLPPGSHRLAVAAGGGLASGDFTLSVELTEDGG